MQNNKIVIALTGGPSGGKTTLLEAIQKEMGAKAILVPEAASILYKGGFPRKKSTVALYHTQRAIYYVQKELELMLAEESQAGIMICDRGSIDGVAYWPSNDSKDYFTSIDSNFEKECARYDWVIHMDTATMNTYDLSNAIRTETYQEALELNEKIKMAWKNHPQQIVITANKDFLAKLNLAFKVITAISQKKSYADVKHLAHSESV